MFYNKRYSRVIVAILVFYVCVIWISYFIPNLKQYEEKLLDSYTEVTIIRKDGTVEQYKNNIFKIVNRGDRIVATINVPEEYRIPDAALCFHLYNSVFSLKYQGRELYRYGDEIAAKGRQIGANYSSVLIPDEVFGDKLILECEVMENKAYTRLSDIMILPATESKKYSIIKHLAEFVIFISLLVVSGLILTVLLFQEHKNKSIRMAILLALFSHMISWYILAYYGMINIISSNIRFSANLEYITVFALPIPVVAYFYELVEEKYLKRILRGILISYSVFMVVCTILNYTTVNYHYSQMLEILHVVIAIGLVILVSVCLKQKSSAYHTNTLAIDGILLFLGVVILEILRFNLDKFFNLHSMLFRMTFLPFGVIAFITMLVLENIDGFNRSYQAEQEKLQLEKLAYLDGLTGLMNRTKCQEVLDKLREEKAYEYTIIFMDLNNLKSANDQFGHKAGDQYIQTAASVFRKYFRNADLCGRMGGDEFIVIYKGKSQGKLELLIKNMDKEFIEINQSGAFDFKMSVACGAVVSTKSHPIDIERAISMADERMYKNKEEIKYGLV